MPVATPASQVGHAVVLVVLWLDVARAAATVSGAMAVSNPAIVFEPEAKSSSSTMFESSSTRARTPPDADAVTLGGNSGVVVAAMRGGMVVVQVDVETRAQGTVIVTAPGPAETHSSQKVVVVVIGTIGILTSSMHSQKVRVHVEV